METLAVVLFAAAIIWAFIYPSYARWRIRNATRQIERVRRGY
jgi:hypothetical protein